MKIYKIAKHAYPIVTDPSKPNKRGIWETYRESPKGPDDALVFVKEMENLLPQGFKGISRDNSTRLAIIKALESYKNGTKGVVTVAEDISMALGRSAMAEESNFPQDLSEVPRKTGRRPKI